MFLIYNKNLQGLVIFANINLFFLNSQNQTLQMKGIFTFLLLTFSVLSIAQNKTNDITTIDERLYEVYDQEYLASLQKNNPFLLKRWSFYLDHAYYIMEYPSDKGNPNYPEIKITNLDDLNILLLEKNQPIVRDFNQQKVYKIKGSNNVLVYYSGKKFNQKLREHLKRS